jgi:hypothetical protein
MAKGNSSRRPVHSWIEPLARFGYATKGAVYILIGVLAVLTALSVGGQVTDTRGAFRAIYAEPFGIALLCAVALGLAAYAVWRVTQAIVDAEGKGRDLKGIAIRIGYAGSGLIHAGLSVSAVRLLLGERQASSEHEHKGRAAQIIHLPLGAWIIGLVGTGFIAFGLYQIYKGYTCKFSKRLEEGAMSADERQWVLRFGQFGLMARGVVFGIIGYCLIQAALEYDPNEVRGLSGALAALAAQPYGKVLLGVTAAGLAFYGVYMLAEAKYHHIRAR